MAVPSLTPKQEMFCQEYLVDLNATQAAIRAGYSAKTAQPQSARLLSNVMVSVRVSELFSVRAEKIGVTAETVLAEFLRIATCDIGGAFDEQGALLPIHDIPIDVRRSISAIEVDELFEEGALAGPGKGREKRLIGYTRKVKFWDKKGSLDSLGRYLKLFVERVEHGADASFAALLAAAHKGE